MLSFSYTVLYAFMYLFLLVVHYRKKKQSLCVVFMLLIWVASSFCGVLYEINPLFTHYHEITLLPYIYLFVLCYLLFFPIIKNNETNVKTISFSPTTIKFLSLFIVTITIPSLCENLIYFAKYGFAALSADRITERYIDHNSTFRYMSTVGMLCSKILIVCSFLVPILFFNILAQTKKFGKLVFGLLMSFFNLILQSYILGERVMMINVSIMFVFSYLFYRNFIVLNIKKKIQKGGLIFIVSIVVIFISISVVRFYSQNFSSGNSIVTWYLQYAGEGHGNFNADMWNANVQSGQNLVMRKILNVLGIKGDASKSLFADGYKNIQFYTTVGQFYGSDGRYFTIVFIIALSFIFTKLTRMHSNVEFSTITLYFFYAKIPLLGFTYFAYSYYPSQLIIIPMITFLISIFDKMGKRRKISCCIE